MVRLEKHTWPQERSIQYSLNYAEQNIMTRSRRNYSFIEKAVRVFSEFIY